MQGNGSVFEKAAAVGVLARVKQALSKFWKGVADFLGIHYTSAEEVADRVMKDLLEGVDPREFGETKDDGARFSAKQKKHLKPSPSPKTRAINKPPFQVLMARRY